jgi:hypothetical protein
MRFRSVALFLLLWLPLQSWAGVAMPFCKHAMHGNTQSMSPAQAHPDGHAHHPAPPAGHSDADTACNDCGACHLACAPALPMPDVAFWMPACSTQCTLSALSFSLFDPEQSKRPPIA